MAKQQVELTEEEFKRQQVVFTEEEAKQKDCPLGGKCSGNACMGWRWAQGKHTKAFNERVVKYAQENNLTWGKAHQQLLQKKDHEKDAYTEGYCGLGGDPKSALRG